MRNTRPIAWLKAARRLFEGFPEEVQLEARRALTAAAEGSKAGKAKPLKGIDHGVFEMALWHRGDAYRIVYALQIDADLWVVHAFRKKSKRGLRTPRTEIDLVRDRIKRLKEALR